MGGNEMTLRIVDDGGRWVFKDDLDRIYRPHPGVIRAVIQKSGREWFRENYAYVSDETMEMAMAFGFPPIRDAAFVRDEDWLVCACGETIYADRDATTFRCRVCPKAWTVAITVTETT
jgi:hypothetical protein